MTQQSPCYLIVGLGNPGKAYASTRHNIGFRILEAFAAKMQWTFRASASLHSQLAEGKIGEQKILLLEPMTYMNSSGEAVKLCSSYYKVPLTQLIVVSDDIYLPLGRLRIRTSGSSGGHNGLKSIETHLNTQAYLKMRVGVGNRESGDLADYVLSPFLKEEEQKLPPLIERAVEALELWLSKGVVAAMEYANICREEEKPEKNLGE